MKIPPIGSFFLLYSAAAAPFQGAHSAAQPSHDKFLSPRPSTEPLRQLLNDSPVQTPLNRRHSTFQQATSRNRTHYACPPSRSTFQLAHAFNRATTPRPSLRYTVKTRPAPTYGRTGRLYSGHTNTHQRPDSSRPPSGAESGCVREAVWMQAQPARNLPGATPNSRLKAL